MLPASFKVPSVMRPTVCIIGLGNWGSSLAHAVTVAGISLREVIIPSGRHAARKSVLPVTTFDHALLDANIFWLCVPDSSIARVASRLARRCGRHGLEGRIVVHSSGALNKQVLERAARAGASVAAVHPMMSFPTHTPVPLRGVPFAVEAGRADRRILDALIRRLGGNPFPLQSAKKTLYHLAGMLSSPLLVSHLAAASEIAMLAGLDSRQALQVIEPITRVTVENFFGAGAGRSFSGPIARGDVATIRLHLQALQPHPMLASVYRSLALYAIHALPAFDSKKLKAALNRK